MQLRVRLLGHKRKVREDQLGVAPHLLVTTREELRRELLRYSLREDLGWEHPRSLVLISRDDRQEHSKTRGSSKLEGQLAAQKKGNALDQAAYENRRAREADEAAEARAWN